MKGWMRIWILAIAPAIAWGQASTGLPAPSTNGIGGVPVPTLVTGYLYYNSGTNSFVFQSPSGSGTVNNCASAYAVAYYAGSGTAVSCPAAFTGVGYFSTTSAPTAATGAQIVSAIGSSAVANATSFTGSLSGDVTGTQSATTVGKINGGAVPASASLLSSNASSQLTAATNITTTASSTLGGSANLFNNASAATNVVEIQAGTSAAQTEQLQWQNYSGAPEWDNTVDTSYAYRIQDAAHSSLDRITIYQGGGNTNINAGSGAYAVCLNCAASSGTSGLLVQNGASSPSTVLTVTGSGNTTATGFVSGKFLMGSGTMTLASRRGGGIEPVDCLRDEPRVRRRERHGDADDRNESDNGNAGYCLIPQHAFELRQLRGDDRERDRRDHHQHMDRKHDRDHHHGERGADGFDGVHGEVLVRRELNKYSGTGGVSVVIEVNQRS
jgi:hypothetical protein